MVLLPRARALGILGIPEVIPIGRLSQPGLLERPLPGLAAGRFEAITLAVSTAGVGKEKLFAVQALASEDERFHQY